MPIKILTDISDWRSKRVLLRCDFNVPVIGSNRIDDYKIVRSLPTLRLLLGKGARVAILTHFGRPDGKRAARFELTLIQRRLSALLGKKISYIHDCVGVRAREAVASLQDGQAVLLENVRFYPEEEQNDLMFAKGLAALADIYVNEAFAVSHRAHASLSAIQRYLPSYAGLLLADELCHLQDVKSPRKPLVVVMGGSKIATKAPVIKQLSKHAGAVLIGGMLAYDFLAAKKLSTGRYHVDVEAKRLAKKTLQNNIILPVDFVTSRTKQGKGEPQVVAADALPKNSYQLDIGPKTIQLYAQYIKNARTILWNGPLGMFEHEHFRHGTHAIARLIATRSRGQAFGIVGGGETITALQQVKMLDDVDWVSTGGGAMLAYLAGEKLPGLKRIVK